MGLQRRYKIVFTQETITDEGVSIKEKEPIQVQICIPEQEIRSTLIPENTIAITVIDKMCEELKARLEKPNSAEHTENDESKEQIIIPLHVKQ